MRNKTLKSTFNSAQVRKYGLHTIMNYEIFYNILKPHLTLKPQSYKTIDIHIL